MSFQKDIQNFIGKMIQTKSKKIIQVVNDEYTNIIQKTSVDTGKLRANWIVSDNLTTKDLETSDSPVQGQQPTSKQKRNSGLNKMIKKLKSTQIDAIYIANQQPYVFKQNAKHNMVEIS